MAEDKRILIVDDEPDILKMTEFRIKRDGYITITAVDGKEGLNKAREEKPDLIVLDYRLPEMNGLDVYAELRATEETRIIPVIFLTASKGNEDIKEAMKAVGAKHLLTKPYDPAVLLGKIKEMLI